MKAQFLFPYRLKKVSGVLFFSSVILFIAVCFASDTFSGINPELPVFAVVGEGEQVFKTSESVSSLQTKYFSWVYNPILDEVLFLILIISGIVYAFSQEKVEDEMVMKIRLDSLVWATYFNYIAILVCYLFCYGLPFLYVMLIAMFSLLLFFIIRFRWMVYQYKLKFNEE